MLRSHSVLWAIFTLASASMIGVLAGCTQQDQPAEQKQTATDGHMHDHDHASSGDAEVEAALAKLSPEDRALAKEQRVCPVTGEPLGSMGVPKKISVEGQEIFICCVGCEDAVRENPKKYLQASGR
jgi:YHS domain-containing protein